jgi:CRP/FNR family transcriptional regulator, cyclic AMP receptor protein
MLRDLPRDMAAVVTSACRPRRFGAGEVIFHAGDPADSLYILRHGHVEILAHTPLGQQLTYTILGPDQSFGELSLLMDDPVRSATARALDATETLVLKALDLARLRRENPALDDGLLKVMGGQVLRLSQQLTEFLYLPVETRVRRRLVDLCSLYQDAAGPTVIPLSQHQIASLAGAARATVNRVLRQEETLGIVALHRRHVTILDRARLHLRAARDP